MITIVQYVVVTYDKEEVCDTLDYAMELASTYALCEVYAVTLSETSRELVCSNEPG